MTTKSSCFQDYVKCIIRRPTADPAKDLDCGLDLAKCFWLTIRGAMVTTGASQRSIDTTAIRSQLSHSDVSTLEGFASQVRAIAAHTDSGHRAQREQDLGDQVERYMTALAQRQP